MTKPLFNARLLAQAQRESPRVLDQQFPLARSVVDREGRAAAVRQGRHSNPSPTRGDVKTFG
jgi:hypothetical protein